MLSIVLALVAAFLFSLGTVFQQKAAMEESADGALQAGFLLRLARKPVWLLGIGMDGLAYVAQAVALGVGRLVVVEPLLIASVVFALPLGMKLTGQRVGLRELIGAAAVTGGIAAFLVISAPSEGRDDAPLSEWLVAGGIVVALTIALVLLGLSRKPGVKAGLFGTASGILFGLVAALTKSTVDRFDNGIVSVVADWHLYTLVVVSVVAFALLQISLQAGALAPAIATVMAFQTVAGGAIGLVLFEEEIRSSPARIAAALAVLIVALAGLVLLSLAEAKTEAAAVEAVEAA